MVEERKRIRIQERVVKEGKVESVRPSYRYRERIEENVLASTATCQCLPVGGVGVGGTVWKGVNAS
jgi:hypothetical protein